MSPLDPPGAPPSDDLCDPDALRVRALLRERAAIVAPQAAPVGQLVRRARRLRRRRTSVAVGAGLAAAAAVGAVVVVDRGESPDLELGVADAGSTSTMAPPPTVAGLVFTPEPSEAYPLATGSPLRMGLDISGAVVTSAMDTPDADRDPGRPASVAVDFHDANGTRRLAILASFDVPERTPTGGPVELPVLPTPTTSIVDLGDGTTGMLMALPAPFAGPDGSSGRELTLGLGDDRVTIVAAGLTDDEVLAVARGISVDPGPALRVSSVPDDLVPGAPRDPSVGGGGMRSQLVYRLADGSDAVIDVVSRPGDTFAAERERVRLAPTPEVFLTPVRGADAVVRRLPGFGPGGGEVVTVTWIEPSGNLVTVRIEPPGTTAADPDLVASGIVELDEAAFQELLTDPGPN